MLMDRNVSSKFEDIVGKIIHALGFDVDLRTHRPYGPRAHFREIDILARNSDGVVLPVEVKLTVREQVALSQLRDASSQTANMKDIAINTRPLLVYGAYIDPARRVWAEEEFRIEIWDRELLLQKAGPVFDELNKFFTNVDKKRAQLSPPAVVTTPPPTMEFMRSDQEPSDPQPEPPGEALIASLTALPPGKKDAKAYETICKDIIDYLFGDDLRDVRSQKRTADGLNIYDLIYRVSPKHPFWVTLTRDFRARVVLLSAKTTANQLVQCRFSPQNAILARAPFDPFASYSVENPRIPTLFRQRQAPCESPTSSSFSCPTMTLSKCYAPRMLSSRRAAP